jgi:vacuolar-type H+-ATPase subunit E/Vma4
LVIRLRPQDQERCGETLLSAVNAVAPGLWQGVSFENLPEDSIGGMMLLNDQRTIRFDLTLQTLLEDQRGTVGELLHDTFDKAGMNDE